MSYDLECPYCGDDVIPCEDQREQEVDIERECPHCGKVFIYQISYHPVYSAHKADCLNGGAHDYRPMRGWPAEYFAGRKKCKTCGHQIKEK